MNPDPPLLADLGQAGPFGRLALVIAAGELGVHERQLANRGERVDAYLEGVDKSGVDLLCALRYSGQPCPNCDGRPVPSPRCAGSSWCGRFARWCVDRAAQQLGQPSPVASWRSLASALKWRDQARMRRALVDTAAPGRVGLHLEDGGHGHVTLVERVVGQVITTIAGNEGNAVATRERPLEYFTGGFVELG